jgi:hypothetical protein
MCSNNSVNEQTIEDKATNFCLYRSQKEREKILAATLKVQSIVSELFQL